jgi:hypothetical protein
LLKSNSLLILESTDEDGFSVCETTPLIDQALLDVVAHYLPGLSGRNATDPRFSIIRAGSENSSLRFQQWNPRAAPMNSSSITPAIENACIASPRGSLRTAEMDVRALFYGVRWP